MIIIQHPIKMDGLKNETLALRAKTIHFYGADKAQSASERHMSEPQCGCEWGC